MAISLNAGASKALSTLSQKSETVA